VSEECIFCKIIEGEGNARKLYEDETTLCILDIAQVVSDTGNFIPGRSLVIPKKHVAWFYDLEDEEAGQLFIAAKIIARKLKKAFNPDFVTVIIRGQRIPHAHIILQPSGEGDPMDNWLTTMRSTFKLAPEELLDDMARKIQKAK
jgi:histidine triad (HIT) family protein